MTNIWDIQTNETHSLRGECVLKVLLLYWCDNEVLCTLAILWNWNIFISGICTILHENKRLIFKPFLLLPNARREAYAKKKRLGQRKPFIFKCEIKRWSLSLSTFSYYLLGNLHTRSKAYAKLRGVFQRVFCSCLPLLECWLWVNARLTDEINFYSGSKVQKIRNTWKRK